MNTKIHHILDEVLGLAQEERSALVIALLESLDDGPEDLDVTKAWSIEANRRKDQLASGASKGVPWAEAKARLLAL